jgi:hypothetical protein
MSNRLLHPGDVRPQEIDNIFVSSTPGNDLQVDFYTGAVIAPATHLYYEIYRLVQVACKPSKITSFMDHIGNIHFIGTLRINIATGEADNVPQPESRRFLRYTRYSADSLRTLGKYGTALVRATGAHHLNHYRELIRSNFLLHNGYNPGDI